MNKKNMMLLSLLLPLMSCGASTSHNSDPSVANSSSLISSISSISSSESLPDSSSVSNSSGISVSDAPVYPQATYEYDFSTFRTTLGYENRTLDLGNRGYSWSFSSCQNQGTDFYIGSNGKNGNDAYFGLTHANGFFSLLEPTGYSPLDTLYGMKMEFDMPGANSFAFTWLKNSSAINISILYSTDSGDTWNLGFQQNDYLASYETNKTISLSRQFTGRVRYAMVFNALSLTSGSGSTVNAKYITIT